MDPDETAATPRYLALLQLLRTASVLWEASRIFFDRWNLSPSQFNVLNLLHANPEGLSQTELSRQLLTHRSNVTGLVDRLERRGLVRRNEASSDRRAYSVVLTKTGTKLVQEILPHYFEEAEQVWDGISGGRISELSAALEQVAQNAENTGRRLQRELRSRRQ